MSDYTQQTAEFIVKGAEDNAPIVTGFLASSGYVVTKDSSTYGKNAIVSDLLPEVGMEILP